MFTTSRLAMAAALVLGAISLAQAAGGSDHREKGGYDIGPLGQCFSPPDCDQAQDQQGGAPYAYASPYGYAYRYPYPSGWHYTPGYGWHYGRAD